MCDLSTTHIDKFTSGQGPLSQEISGHKEDRKLHDPASNEESDPLARRMVLHRLR